MPALVDAALAVRVNDVLLVMDKTVPITTLPAVFMIFPTLISVRNNEPAAPVTIAEALDVVMVPVRAVLGQALALQFPEPTDDIVADIASEVIRRTKIIGRIRILKNCINGLIEMLFY